jgi:hypothetical protein
LRNKYIKEDSGGLTQGLHDQPLPVVFRGILPHSAQQINIFKTRKDHNMKNSMMTFESPEFEKIRTSIMNGES